MWPTKWALRAFLWSVGALGWVLAVWALKRPIPAPTTRIETKVQYVDRVVTKTVERTVTAPDGTVTEEKEILNEKSQSAAKMVNFIQNDPPSHALGLTMRTDLTTFTPIYGIEAGRRMVGDLWLTIGIDSERNVTGGITWHF